MAKTYPSDASGKQRFIEDMLGLLAAELGRRPGLHDRLSSDLRLSAPQIIALGEQLRRFLLSAGETPRDISPSQYLQAQTVMDFIGVLWLSLNGSQTWP